VLALSVRCCRWRQKLPFTSPLKVVATAVFAVLSATTASGNAVAGHLGVNHAVMLPEPWLCRRR